MNLYRINAEHVCTKDSATYLYSYLTAENDEEVYNWIDKNLVGSVWSEINNGEFTEDELPPVFEILDNDYNTIGSETYKERIIRLKGDMHDEDHDTEDAFYGLTLYDWELVNTNTPTNFICTLVELGILNSATNPFTE
jgi:hypothetical protein